MEAFSRRTLLKRTLKMAGGTAALMVLPSGASLEKAVLAAQDQPRHVDLDLYRDANIDWRQFAGQTVVFDGCAGVWTATIEPQLKAFEKLTGITVSWNVLGEDEFVTKLPITLSSGASTPDVFMINEIGQALAAGWMAPINSFLENKSVTDVSWYDPSDFFPAAVALPTTKGTQWAVPISAEAEVIFARHDLVPHAPATFPALEAAAAAAAKAGSTAGIAMRADPDPSQTPWPLAGYVFSQDGYYIDPDGKPAFTSPETVAGVTVYTDLLLKSGPRGVADWGWEQCVQALGGGAAAMYCDSSADAALLLSPTTAKFAKETVLYHLPAHNGMSRPNVWYWTAGINKKSKVLDAAWLFLQWASSAPLQEQLITSTICASRASAWKSAAVKKYLGAEAASVIHDTLLYADSEPFRLAWTNPNWTAIATALAEGVSAVVAGTSSVKSAMSQTQKAAISALK